MAATSSGTERKTPRRTALSVSSLNQRSTKLSQEVVANVYAARLVITRFGKAPQEQPSVGRPHKPFRYDR